jgi:hypothetical protein
MDFDVRAFGFYTAEWTPLDAAKLFFPIESSESQPRRFQLPVATTSVTFASQASLICAAYYTFRIPLPRCRAMRIVK